MFIVLKEKKVSQTLTEKRGVQEVEMKIQGVHTVTSHAKRI
jgi:hypothetical protein